MYVCICQKKSRKFSTSYLYKYVVPIILITIMHHVFSEVRNIRNCTCVCVYVLFFFCCKNKLGKRIKAASLLYWAASNLGKRKLGQRRFLRNKTLALFDRSLCRYNSSFLSWNRCLDFLAFVGVNLHKRPFAKPQAAILLDWGLCLVSVVHFTKKKKKLWVCAHFDLVLAEVIFYFAFGFWISLSG